MSPVFCGPDLHECANDLCAGPHVVDARTSPVGCLDWQDVRHSYPVFDLAICTAYVLLRAVGTRGDLQPTVPVPAADFRASERQSGDAHPEETQRSDWTHAVQQTVQEVARGYETEFGLESIERDCLYLLVATRLALSLAIGQYTFRTQQQQQTEQQQQQQQRNEDAYFDTARSRGEPIMNTLLHLALEGNGKEV